jgi:hypothetical protein
MREIKIANSDKVALVDDEDFELVNQHSWCIVGALRNYQGSKIGNKIIYMHLFIMGDCDGVVDHIDRDTFNNTKSNLRVVTRSENSLNRVANKGASSKYKGVFVRKPGIFRAIVSRRVNGKHLMFHNGTYRSEELAALAYDKKALEVFADVDRSILRLNIDTFPELINYEKKNTDSSSTNGLTPT